MTNKYPIRSTFLSKLWVYNQNNSTFLKQIIQLYANNTLPIRTCIQYITNITQISKKN